MFRRHTILSSVALAVALACTAGACSDNKADLASKNPKAAMAAAKQRTTDGKVVKLSLTATNQGGVIVLKGSGAYDFPKKQGRFTLQALSGGGADLIIVPGTIYVKLPQKTADGKIWIGLTDDQIATGLKSGDPNLSAKAQLFGSIAAQVDPRVTLDALGASVPDLHKVGSATIRGAKTTHLAGRVDLSDKAIAAAPKAKQAGLQAARQAFGSDGYPVEVWLDHDGRVRRIGYTLAAQAVAGGGPPASTTVKLDLFGFGEPSGISIPKPAEVGDGSAVFQPAATTTTAPK